MPPELLLHHLEVGRVGDEVVRQEERQDPDRHVDEEDPAPVVVVRDEAAERRADGRREDDRHSVHGERHSALRWRERVGQDRLLARPEPAAAEPLEHAEEDERPAASARCRTGTSSS
jgi:hypothetical protein